MNLFLGLIKANFILPCSSRIDIESHLRFFDNRLASVAKNPYMYDVREELGSLVAIPSVVRDGEVYGAEFQVEGGTLIYLISRDYVAVEHSTRSTTLDAGLRNLLRVACDISDVAAIGYELDVFIDDLDASIEFLLDDKSIRPLLVNIKGKKHDMNDDVCGFSIMRNGTEKTHSEDALVGYAQDLCR